MGFNPSMKQYTYDGPVVRFGKCIAHRWTASTYAPTERKARSNLEYRFKKDNNMIPSTQITLPGNIVMVDERSQQNGLSKKFSSG